MLGKNLFNIKKNVINFRKWKHLGHMSVGYRKEYVKWSQQRNEKENEKESNRSNENKLIMCTPFNNSLHIKHERYDQPFYMYNIRSTLFRLLKYTHLLKKKGLFHSPNTIFKSAKNRKDKEKLQQLFMCYTSICTDIPTWSFIQLTSHVLQLGPLNEIIINEKQFLRVILCKILLCRHNIKSNEKNMFYKYMFSILSALFRNHMFLGEYFERLFFFKFLKIVKREENINHIAKHVSLFLSCLSNCNRILKKSNLKKNATDEHIFSFQTNNNITPFIYQQKLTTLNTSLTIIMNILNKIKNYNNFNDTDICNILDFLNEFKITHTIKWTISSNMNNYFTISSKIKTLCLAFYFVASSYNRCSTCTSISENIYKYLYELIYFKRKELNDMESLHFFMLGVAKYKRIQTEIARKQKIAKKRNTYYCNLSKQKFNQQCRNHKWKLCENLKKKIRKQKKIFKEKKLYFVIKQQLFQLLQQKKKKKLKEKYLKSFFQYFSLYHLDNKKTRKKKYMSPLTLIRSHY